MGAINVLIIFAEMFKNDSDDYSCLNQYGYEYFLPFSQLSGGQEASFGGSQAGIQERSTSLLKVS